MWGSREEAIYGWPCWWTPRAWTHKVSGREALALWDFGPRSLSAPLARDPISLLQTVLVGSTGSAPSGTCECLLRCWKTSTRLMYPVRDDLGPWLAGEGKFGPKFILLKGQATLFTEEEGEDGKGLSCEWGQKAFLCDYSLKGRTWIWNQSWPCLPEAEPTTGPDERSGHSTVKRVCEGSTELWALPIPSRASSGWVFVERVGSCREEYKKKLQKTILPRFQQGLEIGSLDSIK